MATQTVSETLKKLAKDLRNEYPRSPRATLAGYVIAARMLDKCRAVLNGSEGEYDYDCRLDQRFLEFAGIDANQFKDYVATGASDDEVANWITQHSRVKERTDIIRWNNQLRDMRLSDAPIEVQVFLEDYIKENVPAHKIVYHFFDVLDFEEGR